MCICVCMYVCVYIYIYIYIFVFVPELHMYNCVIIAMCGVHNVKPGHISFNANYEYII